MKDIEYGIHEYLDFTTMDTTEVSYLKYVDEDKKVKYTDLNEEYLFTIIAYNYPIDVYSDDYGQCFFYKWIDAEGQLNETSGGSYNPFILDDIIYIAQHEFKSVKKIDNWRIM